MRLDCIGRALLVGYGATKNTNASVRAHTGVLNSISLVGAADVVANTLIPASVVSDAGTSEYTGLQEGVNAKLAHLIGEI
jgi:hypothetical protein